MEVEPELLSVLFHPSKLFWDENLLQKAEHVN